MNSLESYFFLFTDTLFSNLAIFISDEIAIPSMVMLKSYNSQAIFLCSLLGYAASIPLNYIFGILIYGIYRCNPDKSLNIRYDRARKIFYKYGVYFIFTTSMTYFGKFTMILSGFVKLSFFKSMAYSIIARALYYIYAIYL